MRAFRNFFILHIWPKILKTCNKENKLTNTLCITGILHICCKNYANMQIFGNYIMKGRICSWASYANNRNMQLSRMQLRGIHCERILVTATLGQIQEKSCDNGFAPSVYHIYIIYIKTKNKTEQCIKLWIWLSLNIST